MPKTSRSNRTAKHQEADEIYDKGVILLNELQTIDLSAMQPDDVEQNFMIAANYIKQAIAYYKSLNAENDVNTTYKLLADFYERLIADKLFDVAVVKNNKEDLDEATYFYKLAMRYYQKAIRLQNFISRSSLLELHFSVLQCLEKLYFVDASHDDSFPQRITDYLKYYDIANLVNAHPRLAAKHRDSLADYQAYKSLCVNKHDLSAPESGISATKRRRTSLQTYSVFATNASMDEAYNSMAPTEQHVVNTLVKLRSVT
jgi:tetratricopeptide (TPR) repeat protein